MKTRKEIIQMLQQGTRIERTVDSQNNDVWVANNKIIDFEVPSDIVAFSEDEWFSSLYKALISEKVVATVKNNKIYLD